MLKFWRSHTILFSSESRREENTVVQKYLHLCRWFQFISTCYQQFWWHIAAWRPDDVLSELRHAMLFSYALKLSQSLLFVTFSRLLNNLGSLKTWEGTLVLLFGIYHHAERVFLVKAIHTGNGCGYSPEQSGDGGARHVVGGVGLLARLTRSYLRKDNRIL